jgi:hypothetical protein
LGLSIDKTLTFGHATLAPSSGGHADELQDAGAEGGVQPLDSGEDGAREWQRRADARSSSEDVLQQKAEAAMQDQLGHAFLTIVRPIEQLRKILESDPYRAFKLSPKAKRIVTFLRGRPKAKIRLPVEMDGASRDEGWRNLQRYVPTPKGPVFMTRS